MALQNSMADPQGLSNSRVNFRHPAIRSALVRWTEYHRECGWTRSFTACHMMLWLAFMMRAGQDDRNAGAGGEL